MTRTVAAVAIGFIAALLAGFSVVETVEFLRACEAFGAVLLGLGTITLIVRSELRGEPW